MTDTTATGLIGQVIDNRYRVSKKLGGGGMGEVYLAEHIRIKRKCAIKVLRAALSGDEDSLKRFKNEAENASMISHPNVAQVYDFGEHGNLFYLAMEFIEGQSMQAVMEKDGVMHPDMVADVIMQSASALDAAHQQQVLHRDVKPDNIMLARNQDGTYLVKLVDFGIARALDSTDKRVTQTGMVVGTPEFMSPEQIAGEPLDARSDLYSLALVAFAALTGAGAFGDSGSMDNLILRLTSRPKTLLEARQGVQWPPRLQTVFDRALAPQRDDRQATAGDFAAELSDAIVQMSPSETSAFYRRALEARSVSPVALTPSATPVKTAKGRDRGKTAASNASAEQAPAPSPRPFTQAGRPAPPQQYMGPVVRTSKAWRAVQVLVLGGGAYIYFTGQGDAAIAQAKVWAAPALRMIDNMRGKPAAADSTPAVVTAPVTPKPLPKKPAAKKPDSAITKTDSAPVKAVVPPPPVVDTLSSIK